MQFDFNKLPRKKPEPLQKTIYANMRRQNLYDSARLFIILKVKIQLINFPLRLLRKKAKQKRITLKTIFGFNFYSE